MSRYLTPGLAAAASALLQGTFGFTYTRAPVSRPTLLDDYGNRPGTPGTPVPGVPCRYISQARLVVNQDGRVIAFEPAAVAGGDQQFADVLMVAPTDPIAVGDQVSTIVSDGGTVAATGPLDVEAVLPGDSFGYLMHKLCVLRGPITERPAE